MVGQTISHYKILHKIGEGGVGIVYRAEDLKLDRTVALKFLNPRALESEEQKDRFVTEARAAAALDHPNICTIHEIDEHEGRLFIAMAYVEGANLKDRIRSGPLALQEAVNIASQVAKGLDAAHRKGILHRDIKSANIMVTDQGHARIMDFGLAKIQQKATIADSTKALGTPSYMAPEQIRGEQTDQRGDIWSWGVVFYEMLAGQLPFEAEHAGELIHAVLNEHPPWLSALNAEVPRELERIAHKALAKPLVERYPDTGALLEDLRTYGRSLDDTISFDRVTSGGVPPSTGVLAFVDMSAERDQQYFCQGIAEQIINDLTRVEGLRVASRTSSFAFEDKPEDIREIGRKLGVSTLLEGSVRKAGNRVRITAQLTNVADGYHLWSEQYDRELQDVFGIQEEIAQNIVSALEVELSDQERQALEKAPTHDVEAYDFYLRGRQYFYQSKRKGVEFALEMFQRATERDPDYALAYAGMADCYSYLFMYYDHQQSNLDRADEASSKALQLDPELAEAHAARGLALSLSQGHEAAGREFEQAIFLNPKLFEAYYFFARTCFIQGKMEEAAHWYEQAAMANPDDYQALSLLGFTVREIDPQRGMEAYRKSLKNIERHLELNPHDARATYLGACALAELGEKDKGTEWARRAYSLEPEDPYNIYGTACFFARYGGADEAIDFFEKSIEAGFAHKEWVDNDNDLDKIREHPRFKTALNRLD
jgi:serine/threonine protein kinase/tetratricopeptide (TPR) repeat protein